MEGPIEIAILVAVALPFVRLALTPGFVRRLAGAPEHALVGIAALLAYGLIVATTAFAAPALLRPMAVVAVLIATLAWWRSRPNFGRSRGMPPGSLRLAPIAPWVDREYFARDALRFGPIFKTSTFYATTVCVVGFPAAAELFAQHGAALEPVTTRYSTFIERGFIRFMTREDHATYAPMLRAAASGSVMRSAEDNMRTIMGGALENVAAQGATSAAGIARATIQPMFLRLFLGIADSDPRAARIRAALRVIDPIRAWQNRSPEVHRAAAEIYALAVSEPIPEDCFLTAVRARYPDAVNDPTLCGNIVYMLQTSTSDVSEFAAWVVWHLARNPIWMSRVRDANGDARAQLSRRIVTEVMRMGQSESLVRVASTTFKWRDYTIRRGTRVRVCVWESHQDPQVFEQPSVFNPDRWLDVTPSHDRYSPFGATGDRRCVGEAVTFAVARMLVEGLACGYDVPVVHDEGIEFSGVHWRPSTKFRIALVARHPAAVEATAIQENVGGLIPVGQ